MGAILFSLANICTASLCYPEIQKVCSFKYLTLFRKSFVAEKQPCHVHSCKSGDATKLRYWTEIPHWRWRWSEHAQRKLYILAWSIDPSANGTFCLNCNAGFETFFICYCDYRFQTAYIWWREKTVRARAAWENRASWESNAFSIHDRNSRIALSNRTAGSCCSFPL